MKFDAKIPGVPDSSVIDRIFAEKVKDIESRIGGKVEPEKKESVEESSFFSDLMKSMALVRNAHKEAKEKSIKMVLGEIEDIHDVMIAREKAETLFRLFLEIRNKAVQAFDNIMRMQF